MSSSANKLAHLAPFFTRWVGVRSQHSRPPSPHRATVWIWSFIGAFAGITALFMLFGRSHYFQARHVPPIIGSFAASAVLCFGAIQAPFSQPRALVGGHLLASIIGVCINKIFALLPPDRYEDLRWLSAALSCAVTIVGMDMLNVTHPPAGATALLACSEDGITAIGWLYIPVILLSSLIMLVIALCTNNIQRRYPVYWLAPTPAISQPLLPISKNDTATTLSDGHTPAPPLQASGSPDHNEMQLTPRT
ncbi:HPP family-domain-containing protein [Auriculariales sp. MPI-PUGE-AT-0066]|nr:HPP family-domain-containing protein [Auriculariales sp. MPI-PUGE-AT-0066]